MTSVTVVDRSGLVQLAAEYALERIGEPATLTALAPFRADSPRTDVLLLGPGELGVTCLQRVARWHSAYPGSVVVAVLPPGATATDRALLRGYGVAVAVGGSLARGCVTRALRQALALVPREVAVPVIPEPRVEAVPEPATPAPRPRVGGTLVTVASAAGGCGKTFFATNAATMLSRAGHRVLLVDLDLQFGEVAAALRIRHPYSLYDGLYDASGRHLDAAVLADHLDALVHRHPLGFDVLTAPRDPGQSDNVGARDADAILDVVLPRYDVVVVDTPPTLNEVVLTALDRSTTVAVLATLDVPSLKNMKLFLDTLRRLRIDDARLRLVLNKVEADIGVDVAAAQDAFANRFVGTIPLSRSVSRSINSGTVLVDSEPRSECTRQLTVAIGAVLAGHVDVGGVAGRAKRGGEAAVPEQRSWRGRLMRLVAGSRDGIAGLGGAEPSLRFPARDPAPVPSVHSSGGSS